MTTDEDCRIASNRTQILKQKKTISILPSHVEMLSSANKLSGFIGKSFSS